MSAPAAYRADGRPVERGAFYALACDPERSVVVEACAGAGKTWMLVSRILRALVDGVEPQEILAITFTRKAAGEMRERLDGWLREFASPATPHEARVRALVERGVAPRRADALAPALGALHERLLRGGRPVQVHTFHAWFAQLLRAAPLDLLAELGLQPDMELIENIDDHRHEVVRRFHAALLRDPARRADHAALVAQRGRGMVRRWLDAAWARRVEFELADEAGVLESSVATAAAFWPGLAPFAHPCDALFGAAWCDMLGDVLRCLCVGPGKPRATAAAELAAALAEPDASRRFERAFAALFTDQGTPRKQLGAEPDIAAAQDALNCLAEQVRQHDACLEHGRLVRLARVLLAELAAYKRHRGLADMADLERCGLALLRDATLAGWVQERLDARVRQVLIDEFQDTSPLQWHAIEAWWSGYAGAGGGASGQRAPAVFIVGDPKQSIYRFRGAEPRVFAAARDFVCGALGGVMLECDHTRRNAPEVLAALNVVFERATEAGDFDGFRRHTTEVPPLADAGVQRLPRAERPPRRAAGAAAGRLEWRDTLQTPRRAIETVLREKEAAEVAAAVRELIDRQGVRPGEIFVLSRKRQSLRFAADALRRLQVPHATVEAVDLMAAAEARDLVAVLDAIGSRQHRLSLAQALRSPLFAASDDDLVALAGQAAGGDWWRALTELEQSRPALQRAAHLLPRWQAAAQRLPPHDLLDRIVAEGELRERVAATVAPAQRTAALDAIDAVLAQALTLDGARYATPYNFVRALRRRVLRATAPARTDAVQLLTVHGAKGLEARIVFVMDAEPEPKSTAIATLLVDWPVHAARPLRCAFVYAESQCPASLQTLLGAEQVARQREELNGLYVAMSRARERLVFSATPPSRPAPRAPWWARIEALAAPWQPARPERTPVEHLEPGVPVSVLLQTEAAGNPVVGSGSAATYPPAVLTVLPDWHAPAPSATEGAAVPSAAGEATGDATRLGHAVHRVLEWSTGPVRAAADDHADLGALAAAAALEHGVAAADVGRIVGRILASPDCAPFFDRRRCGWAGNEVPVADGAELLRIDRLVRHDGPSGPVWWVLDYKLAHAPERVADHREQLLRYRRAVQRLQPDARIRCAFITRDGALVEIE